jgi:hypothetical protein
MPLALPWLAILMLLMLKPNRCAQAWWIWLPLGCVAALETVGQSLSAFLPSSVRDVLLEVVIVLTLGIAAVWLLSTYLGQQYRFLTSFCVLLAMAGFSVPAFTVRQGWDLWTAEALQTGILLAACVFVVSVALSLAGLLCRGRYRPLGLSLWLIASLLVIWSVVIAPFFVVVLIASRGTIPVTGMIAAVLVMTGVSFASLLPSLILSFAHPFFRERLKRLLHLVGEVPPPLSAPERAADR